MAASQAFRESFTSTNELNASDPFASFNGRTARYKINFAMYENTAYRDVHTWAQSYKTEYGLYRFIRNIESPASRLGDFWQSHLWGGLLDAEAGDGKAKPSALPIVTDSIELRKAIAKVWEWSNWQGEKDVVTLRGAVLGDSFIRVEDDPERRKVYLSALHPGSVKEIEIDAWGNVKEYVLEEQRLDPEKGNVVTYREEVTRGEGDNIVYKTYVNGSLYPWGKEAEYEIPYGFVPLVFIRHRNVGSDWGWSEMHAGMSLFREVDDQASLLNDQIRKMVNSVWLFSGVSASDNGVTVGKSDPTDDNPQAGREDTPALYGPIGASAQALVSPLDINATALRIEKLVSKIERDYPELADNISNATGVASGRALRIARQPVIDRVENRRPNYDTALVRAHQMAIAIGGWKKYDAAFSGYDLNSFKAGKLNHTIAERPVFAKDPLDDLEVDTQFWTTAKAAKDAGGMVAMRRFFLKNGWTEKEVKEFEDSPEHQARTEALKNSAKANMSLTDGEFNRDTNSDTMNETPQEQEADNA